MKQFYLIINPDKEQAEEVAKSICQYLESKGCHCAVQGENPAEGPRLYKYTDASQIPKQTECIITLGGDGTLIQAARDLAGREIPIIGVNLGTLGYLTQISRQEDITKMLDDLIHDQYQVEKRMMLKGVIYRNGEKIYEGQALNEIVLTRREMLRVLKFRIYVNEEYLNEYTADGMIIATPTGSTAYNLSAGGPIVEPAARMTVLTPICPHALNMRSIVFPAEDRVEIEITGRYEGNQAAAYDGDAVVELKTGDRIQIEEAKTVTRLIKLRHISFLDNLREKMTGV